MRVLVTGVGGLLGSQVGSVGQTTGWSVVGTYHTEEPTIDLDAFRLDVRDGDRFSALLDTLEPAWVINCAAMTDVDACERDPDTAHAVNGHAPGTLAARCDERSIGFCHVSTDYVFDGGADEPYREEDEPSPVQAYGTSKLEGERRVRACHDSALIGRLSFLYGLHGGTGTLRGFPAWVRDRLESGREARLYADQRVTPTRAGQAARTLRDLVERGSSGTYHIASRSCVTPFEFGSLVRDRMNAPTGTIAEGSLDRSDTIARRPRYTCLDVGSLEAELGRDQPTLRADLDAIKGALRGQSIR